MQRLLISLKLIQNVIISGFIVHGQITIVIKMKAFGKF